MGIVPFYSISPESDLQIGIDFVDDIPPEGALASCSCSARKFSDDTDVTGSLLVGGTSCTILSGSTQANIYLRGIGLDTGLYEVLFFPVLADGQKLKTAIARVMIDN